MRLTRYPLEGEIGSQRFIEEDAANQKFWFQVSDSPLSLSEALGQAVGAASVCWESMEGTGIFQDDRARDIVIQLERFVESNYIKKENA